MLKFGDEVEEVVLLPVPAEITTTLKKKEKKTKETNKKIKSAALREAIADLIGEYDASWGDTFTLYQEMTEDTLTSSKMLKKTELASEFFRGAVCGLLQLADNLELPITDLETTAGYLADYPDSFDEPDLLQLSLDFTKDTA